MLSLKSKCLKNKFSFYNFKNFESVNKENDMVIKFSKNKITRYCDLILGGNPKEYEHLENDLLQLLNSFFDTLSTKDAVAIKYADTWVVDKKESSDLYLFLHKRKLDRKKFLYLQDNKQLFLLLSKSTLRYNTFCQFLFPENELVLTVTDHLDIFVSTPILNTKNKVREVVEQYSSLQISQR